MPLQKLLKQKLKSASEVARLVKTGDILDYGFGITQPDLFDTALTEQKDSFGEAPEIYRKYLDVDMLVIKTTPMDSHGYFNFGVSNTYAKASCDAATKIVVETSTEMPICYGTENCIHITEVEAVIEGDNAPLFELPIAPMTSVDRASCL